MERSKKKKLMILDVQEEKQRVLKEGKEKVVSIDWEDYQQELARLCSLTSALEEAKKKKISLQEKLNSLIQVEADSLNRSNELDQIREKVESRKLVMGNMSLQSKVMKEKLRKREEQLSAEIRSLLTGGSSLSAAKKNLQDSTRSFAGEKGYGHMQKLQKLLMLRQQFMVSQVALLYPVKIVFRKSPAQELQSFSSTVKPNKSKPIDQGMLTILGLQLNVLPFTKMSFFTDKKEVHRSSTALGYIAHAVSLIASYLRVPIRYPLRFGGSRSFVRDYAPSLELSASSPISDPVVSTSANYVEFPLFLEGQDTTRAAYAVFLLNKDLEQLLNFIGVKSLGPRHVLANLRELVRTVLSPDYLNT